MTDRILIGRIKAAHGIRGEVLVTSFAAAPEDLGHYGVLESEDRSKTIELHVVRVTPKGVVARVSGVADRTSAEALAGLDIYIDRKQLPEPEPDEFYHADLIGLDAVTAEGRLVGRIIDVPNYGAGDLLEIRLEGSRKSELVPFTDAYVPALDLAGRRVTVVLPTYADDDGPHTEHDSDGT